METFPEPSEESFLFGDSGAKVFGDTEVTK